MAEAEEALSFYRSNHYTKETVQCLTAIGRGQRDTGDYDSALASFRAALTTAQETQDPQLNAQANENLGSLLFETDNFPEALQRYSKNLELAVDEEHLGFANLQCGNALWRLGEYSEAETRFSKADAFAEKFPRLRLQLLYARAGMLLSQNRFHEAEEETKAALTANVARSAETEDGLNQILGLSLIRSGRTSEGLALCERIWTAAAKSPDISNLVVRGVALLEARIAAGRRFAALDVFHQIDTRLPIRPEMQWRAYALVSRIDASYKSRARDALTRISHLWGDSRYNTYLNRRDVQKLSGPLSRPDSALEK